MTKTISKIFKNYLSIASQIKPKNIVTTLYDDVKRKEFDGGFAPGDKDGFENHAFARLYDSRSELGIRTIFQCRSARTDGLAYLANYDDHPLLLEMKTTLSWSSLGAALAAFVTGHYRLKEAKKIEQGSHHCLILFSRFSSDWIRHDDDSSFPWAMLYRHLAELESVLKISALQITPSDFENPFVTRREGFIDLMSLFEH